MRYRLNYALVIIWNHVNILLLSFLPELKNCIALTANDVLKLDCLIY